MKKSLIVLVGVLLGVSTLLAQTNATDFTADNCHGDEHHLFSELDAGKVIVLAWVMPCGSCVPDPVAAYGIVGNYSESHPGRVLFYIADDYANTTCLSLNGWVNNYEMGDATTFSDPAISMSDYGADGMPKIVVLAGQDHLVYFNENSSTTGLSDAIDLALAENPLGVEAASLNQTFQLYPNPSVNQLTIELGVTEKAQLSIVNLLGEEVSSFTFSRAINKQVMNTSLWNNGVYFAKLYTADGEVVKRFVVAH